jgi:hypothetical protein
MRFDSAMTLGHVAGSGSAFTGFPVKLHSFPPRPPSPIRMGVLIIRRFEVAGLAIFPGDGRAAGLFNQAAQIQLGRPELFRITVHDERGQQGEEFPLVGLCLENLFGHRIDGSGGIG